MLTEVERTDLMAVEASRNGAAETSRLRCRDVATPLLVYTSRRRSGPATGATIAGRGRPRVPLNSRSTRRTA